MATVHRTFVNRGKKEITELKPNYTYAVEYTLDPEAARPLGIRCDQVGIIVTDNDGNISHNWNIDSLCLWSRTSCDMTGKHVWLASSMEQAFASQAARLRKLTSSYSELSKKNSNLVTQSLADTATLAKQTKEINNLSKTNAEMRFSLDHYENHPLHRFAENCIDIWNKIKQAFKRNK